MNVDATVRLSQKPGTAGHGIFFGQTLKDDKEENEDIHEKGNVFNCLSHNGPENCK